VSQTFGLTVSRNSIRRALRRAKLTWKKVKKLLVSLALSNARNSRLLLC
jgi:transposase